jgi:hypothetical protein
MFNEIENSQFYSLCLFFLQDYLELEKPFIHCEHKDILIAEWFGHEVKLQINMKNLDTDVFIKNMFDHRTNLYNYGKRYLLKKHIHSGLKIYG